MPLEDFGSTSGAGTSRRTFVAGASALVVGSTLASPSLLAMQAGANQAADTGAPRGKQRNLLAKACSPETLQRTLLAKESYRPFAPIEDRAAWDGLRAETRATLLAAGKKFLKYEWPEMPATVFLQYARNGNRTGYQNIRGKRLAALRSLMLAECVENKGRFLDDIANGIWATCEESFWGVPAHLYIQKADLGLADPNDPIVDLFAAETAALVATVDYLLNTKLDTVSPLLRERIYFEQERRILKPCLEQNFMWMGLPGGKTRADLPWITVAPGAVQPVNNWDAWICWNWLTVVLFTDRNAERRVKGVAKVLTCLDKFINTYPDDGGCEEGPGYFNVAAGAMFDALELLHSSTGGSVDIFTNPLLREMALYMNRVHVTGRYYLNPGDASPLISLDADKMHRYAKRIHEPSLVALAVSSFSPAYVPSTLPAIFNERALRAEPLATAELLRDVWLPETRVMAARMKANSSEGLYVAAIASDNGKSHSHNDTGNVWVYLDGLPVLIDMGQETYQKKSFDSGRYEIPSTQSSFHNLPEVGGIQQGVGPEFRATDVVYRATDKVARVEMELATAYPTAAKVKSWRRTVQLDREKQQVEIAERFLLNGSGAEVVLNLMTGSAVSQLSKGVLMVAPFKAGGKTVKISFDASQLIATVETIALNNEELVQNWGAQVYRIRLKSTSAKTSGVYSVLVQSA